MDGTVIDVNSFPLWVRQVLHGRQAHLGRAARVSVSMRCAAAIVRRKFLRGTHRRFKRRLQQLWRQIEANAPADAPANRMTEELLRHLRPNLRLLLQDITTGKMDAILTTAAAAEYALPFARKLGFRHVIATPAGGAQDDVDNVGEVKCRRTLSYIAARGWSGRPRVLFTDHRDDLPLIREADALVWFGTRAEYENLSRLLRPIPVLIAREVDPHTAYDWVLQCERYRGVLCM
jgi:phosphoserine phosphatase